MAEFFIGLLSNSLVHLSLSQQQNSLTRNAKGLSECQTVVYVNETLLKKIQMKPKFTLSFNNAGFFGTENDIFGQLMY